MGKYRPRFNEKARSGMLAKQATLKKARNKAYFRQLDDGNTEGEPAETSPAVPDDPNAEILKPMTDQEKIDRKRVLESQIYSMNEKESKMSRNKRKRLDKYIEHQLKREEKKALFEKLSHTKVDTEMFTPSKILGKGGQTRKEQLVEALELERHGRGDERTKDLLYEEREVKEWPGDEQLVFHQESEGDEEPEEKYPEDDQDASGFIDNRPAKFGGSGFGFGFSNIKKVETAKPVSKSKYSWRSRLEEAEKSKYHQEDEDDFASESDEDSDENQSDIEESDENESDIEDGENDLESGSDDVSDNESDSESDEEVSKLLAAKPKHTSSGSAFKEWAEQQVKQMSGHTEMVLPKLSDTVKKQYSKHQVREEDVDHSSDDENYIPINKNSQRQAFFVDIVRSEEVQNQRIHLPVFNEEHRVMEAVYHHDCIIICGETGSGKTTQVPQFLYEAGFGSQDSPLYPGMIGVTQPRRVAAVSMANRVKNELGDHGHRVGYQIRFDSNIKGEGTKHGTALKFMTDGVLLREMMSDFLLTKYSVIIIDEAHERNINTDILIGMLSRVLKLRRKRHDANPETTKPLKLIIMSATLRVSDFSSNSVLFKKPPPIIKISARQYPVSVHFSRHTAFEYQEEAFKKTCKIHQKLPPGGILIFLTGQAEITDMVKRLKAEFPFLSRNITKIDEDITTVVNHKNVDLEAEEVDLGTNKALNGEEDDYVSSDEEEEGFEESLEEHQSPNDPLFVLPLYSSLPTDQQMKVFQNPPKGSRICVVATNVAETSLTIPGIRYVVDCGRCKERKYNKDTDIQSFEIEWISKASADQRCGRAGRTGPGHCYRLFSSAVYEDFFSQFSDPEILRTPVESTTLSMKSMGIDQVVNFPFPTPPGRQSLAKAESVLGAIGALAKDKTITSLGKAMSHFPLTPRFAKILILGNQRGCLPYIIALVSAFTVGDPFIGELEITQSESFAKQDDDKKKKIINDFHRSRALFSRLSKSSDALCLLSAVCAFDHVPHDKQDDFLKDNYLRPKVMKEIGQLRRQITRIVKMNTKSESVATTLEAEGITKLGVPSEKQVASIKQIVASGFLDQISVRADIVNSEVSVPKSTSIINIPYQTITLTAQSDETTDGFVYIHPHSVLAASGEMPPDMMVYQLLNLSSNRKEGVVTKARMKALVDISGKQLANIAKGSPLLTYSKPLGNKYAPKNITSSKREAYVIPRFGAAIGSGGLGWDLPVIKVVQVKNNGQWINE